MEGNTMQGKEIKCAICDAAAHYIKKHLDDAHSGMSLDDYKATYPDAPIMSVTFEQAALQHRRKKLKDDAATSTTSRLLPKVPEGSQITVIMTELFGIPSDEFTVNGQKQPQQIDVRVNVPAEDRDLIPDCDVGYVFKSEILKDALAAVKLNMPLYLWGMHGSGKSTVIEQICHHTNRPMFRVQHSATTEESHIVGQMVVRDGGTLFDYGPLALAMIHGWVYVADEYDFAQPAVIAVYQAVLEGKPLIIKEAPPEQRVIKPHPHFRFVATGNTNGSGDDTGLYQGTTVQNTAAYSRFGVTINVQYPERQVEKQVIMRQVGISEAQSEKFVDFAAKVRSSYQAGDVSAPISPRELINAAKLGLVYGGKWIKGLELAFINRQPGSDAEALRQIAQKLFA
jgi:cobaltochelatase CobS